MITSEVSISEDDAAVLLAHPNGVGDISYAVLVEKLLTKSRDDFDALAKS